MPIIDPITECSHCFMTPLLKQQIKSRFASFRYSPNCTPVQISNFHLNMDTLYINHSILPCLGNLVAFINWFSIITVYQYRVENNYYAIQTNHTLHVHQAVKKRTNTMQNIVLQPWECEVIKVQGSYHDRSKIRNLSLSY